MEVSSKDKGFNPLIVNLQPLEVGYHEKNPDLKKTIESFYNQIKNNLYVSVKAEYLIARDVYDAEQSLTSQDFNTLIDKLGFAESTKSKYLTVGKDTRLWRLFSKGKLPLKWTTNYLLATLTDAQFERVEEEIDCDMTATSIKQIANVSRKQNKEFENALLGFLQLEVDKTEVDVSSFKKIVAKVKSVLSKIPEVKINDKKVDTVKEKLITHKEKELRQELAITKAKQVLSQAGGTFEKAEAVA